MALLSLTELRDMREIMSADELMDLCRDAAVWAVRAPFSAVDRDDCATTLFADVITRIGAETETEMRAVRTGRPRDVLAYIARMADPSNHPMRQVAAMPRRDDKRVTFTALANRAHDWRRKLETAREHDALMSSADGATDDRDTDVPAEYIAAGARQDIGRARAAATEACRLLGLSAGSTDAPSPVWCTFYVWARERDATECAAELDMAPDAMHQRVSRARKLIKAAYSAPALISALADGTPVMAADGTLTYALRDESRDARNRTPIMAAEPRTRAEDAAEVRTLKTAPDPDATARRLERETERAEAKRMRRLARAHASSRDVHAGTGARRARLGRTSGKPAEKYADRRTRLGRD